MMPSRNLSAIAVLCLVLAGCATLDPGQDPVAVRAEQTTVIAFDVLDTFVNWERTNEFLVGPDVNRFADEIRRQAPVWLTAARELTKTYKANRTPANKANLLTALAVLETAMSQAQRVMANSTNSNLKLNPYT